MNQREKHSRSNAGMSLIELVVVVLIMGVLATATAVGGSYLKRMDASGTAGKIESFLDKGRMRALSVQDGYRINVIIGVDSDGYYGEITQEEIATGTSESIDRTKLGEGGVTISVYEGATAAVIDATHPRSFYYQKSNGAFASTYDKIVVSGVTTKTVHLVLATGRTYQD